MDKDVVLASDLLPFLKEKQTLQMEKVAVLFGCERTGLENKELALSDALLTVPLNPEHSSLNLSQAVLLIAYEFQKLFVHQEFIGATKPKMVKADKKKELLFLNFMNDLLSKKGYYPSNEKREKMQTNLNNIFLKAELSNQEINTLYGVFKHLK